MSLLKDLQKDWAYHKYWVMAHSQEAYQNIRLLFKGNDWNSKKERAYHFFLEEAKKKEPTKATLTNAYQHIWGYFKKISTVQEKQEYLNYLENISTQSEEFLLFLINLSKKYQVTYLLDSRIIQDGLT